MAILALVFVLKPPYPHANAQTLVNKQVAPAKVAVVSAPVANPAPTPTAAPQPEPVVATPQPPPAVTNCGSDPYMAYIYQKESGCRTNAVNASSGAYGICQSLPAGKMASAGADWQTNWETQNRWCISYAISRYGSPQNAYQFWINNHWW